MSYESINVPEPTVPLREGDRLIPNFRPASVGSINDRPLFGESSRDKLLSNGLVVAIIVLIFITILTLVLIQFRFVNVLALFVILSLALSHGLLIRWYRQGDLDPKFRRKLLWDSVNLCLFCIVIILYYFKVNQ